MPDIRPIGPQDPGRVGGHRITGRLGGAVYLAESPAGERVVVRLLPTGLDGERLLAAVEPLRQVSAFCTAEILDTGTADGRPYIVSEYIDGPTLKEAVVADGTLHGAALHRLAVGTVTALVAGHQAGVTHGGIRPENVILGPDGPRVIDFGVAGAFPDSGSGATRPVGVPAFTAPELLHGADPAPPSDLFAWAATLVYAATGRSPFDGGSTAVTVNRVVHDEPVLEAVPDDLRGVVASCLAKDPAARPAASDVLLKLIGELLTADLGPAPSPAPAARRSRGLLLGAGAVAIALVSAGAVYLTVPERAIPAAASPPAERSASPAGEPLPAATATATRETVLYPLEEVAKASKDVTLPGVGVTLHEHPEDPVRLGAYVRLTRPAATFAREKGKDTFREVDPGTLPVLSPDERFAALNPSEKFTQSDIDYLKITEVATGEAFTVPTVKQPFEGFSQPMWSADGSTVLLSIRESAKRVIAGFAIVDVRARKSTFVVTEHIGGENDLFTFAPGGLVARRYFDGKKTGADFFDLEGQVVRTMHWVGDPRGIDWFSPSGKLFYTVCPKREQGLCVWDTATGNRRQTVPLGHEGLRVLGWFNENHLLVQRPAGKNRQVQVVDFTGGVQRVLAGLEAGEEKAYLRFTRRQAS
ncbi:serine/threonine protein kinase [Planomonospora sp. ID91781]|uniref:serine/threonine protein kinase n=1 Tax=Planomonospora sp. ID91781 TaxID=2738135 RepID=UPI0018C3FB88|nr:serine/threonine-protein kinase [Planomonospora sp. ID91781]MBG0823905.1 serine/threonine protein kinase [Planomonospora sp. ID91781]